MSGVPGLSATQVPTVFTGAPIEKRELFRGRSSHTTELTSHVIGGLLAIGGIVLGIVLFLWTVGLAAIAGFVVSCIGGALIFRSWLRVVTVEYRVDTLRVEIERGIVRKRIDNLELWRVKDLQFRQSLTQRMLGLGDVVLVTSDSTNPTLVIGGITGARPLYDALRDAVDHARRARSVVGVESTS